ncbi:MAG: hypothetical protein Kow006_21020 [Gammaproteobacteria bacterium]
MRARRPLAKVQVAVPVIVGMVVVVMSAIVVVIVMMVVMGVALDPRFALTASAYRTHGSSPQPDTRAIRPPAP